MLPRLGRRIRKMRSRIFFAIATSSFQRPCFGTCKTNSEEEALAFWQTQAPNLSAARAFAFAASSSRLFGGALVSSARRRRVEMPAISSTAASNAPSFAFDGLLRPLIFLTNWSEATRISSEVTGGSKLIRAVSIDPTLCGKICVRSRRAPYLPTPPAGKIAARAPCEPDLQSPRHAGNPSL